jgi:hypothetical protein
MAEPTELITPLLQKIQAEIAAFRAEFNDLCTGIETRIDRIEREQDATLALVLDSISWKAQLLARMKAARMRLNEGH